MLASGDGELGVVTGPPLTERQTPGPDVPEMMFLPVHVLVL